MVDLRDHGIGIWDRWSAELRDGHLIRSDFWGPRFRVKGLGGGELGITDGE